MKTNQNNEMKTFRELWKKSGFQSGFQDELERHPDVFTLSRLEIEDWDELYIDIWRGIDYENIDPDTPRLWENGNIICYYHNGINENEFEVQFFEFYEIKENKLKYIIDVYNTQILSKYEKTKLNEIIEKINNRIK